VAYAHPEIRRFLGLFLQANSLGVPDGAMEEARNVIILDDDEIQKLSGMYQYYNPSALVINALILYQNTLLAAFTDRLAYFTDTGSAPSLTGTKTDLSGETFAVTAPRVARSLEQSGNLYVSTDNGVLKIDAYNGKIFKTGAPPGLDLRGTFNLANGVIGNGQVGYRVLYGRVDANDNTILGTPSDILVLTNTMVTGATYTSVAGFTVTVTSVAHRLLSGQTIVVSSATDADANGSREVTVTGVDTFTFTTVADPLSGTLNYYATKKPHLEFSVDREITTAVDKWFYRVYRTSQSGSDTTPPEVDFKQLDQQYLTAAQINAGVVFYDDVVPDILLTSAPELYTNPNSGEGEAQSNQRPPKCEDMTLFQGYAFYLNCTTRHTIEIDVVDSTVMATGDKFEIKIGATIRTYTARTGVGNSNTTATTATFVTTTITVNYVAHGLVVGDVILVSNAQGTGTLPSGTFTVATAVANSFTFTAGTAPGTLSTLDFQGVRNSATEGLFTLDSSSGSASVRLASTAKGLIKAVNRDASSLVYANYISGVTDTPGKMRFTAVGFGTAMNFRITAGGSGFTPVLPASFAAGDQVLSKNESKRNEAFVSKYQEPEAAPLANSLAMGSKNKAILRGIALRNSVIVLKEDGVFKITGDNPRNFTATPLDNTVFIIAGDSASKANNTVYFLSNQGVCSATDSAVTTISRQIERVIRPIVGKANVATATTGVGYESNRTYRISTIAPNDTTRTITYVYNFLNDTWTDTDTLYTSGVVGPSDILYVVDSNGKLLKERKSQDKTDFCGQNYAITVTSVAASKLSAVIESANVTPQVGDAIIKSSVITRIDTVTGSGTTFTVTFSAKTNLAAADSLQLYQKISSRVTFAPFHGGAIGREKQFSQLQMHTRDNGIYRLYVSFTNTYVGASEETTWFRPNVSGSGGWGELPWGYFPWGLAEGINNPVVTTAAPPIRLYLPLFAQRATFVRTVLRHEEACDPMNLQALAWSIRAYAERTGT
jgi:hypothetical protein